MTRSEVVNLYLDHLRDEGFRPGLDGDGDIRFKIEGRTYVILVDERDLGCIRIVYPSFWSVESPSERQLAIEAAERATAETKVAKVYLVGESTWAAFEMLCDPPESLKAVFPRAIRTIRAATRNFVERMKKRTEERGVVGRA